MLKAAVVGGPSLVFTRKHVANQTRIRSHQYAVLSLKEYDDCKRIFRERGMRTFGDWLGYYNNLDVAPFLQALQKMKEFYTNLGVDIFKDAVSLPMYPSSTSCVRRCRAASVTNPPSYTPPNKEAYDMLKAAVVGGPSLVFTRKHVANQTRIRSHQYEDAKPAKRILGYDANSLYPSMMRESVRESSRLTPTPRLQRGFSLTH